MARDHAIVLGAGCAGMLAAKVLADHFARVTLVDRTWESGRIPQGVHLHVLLKRGQEIFAGIFPGIMEELARSCPYIDWAEESEWVGPYGDYPRYPSALSTYMMSRAHLDALMIKQIAATNNIAIVRGAAAAIFDIKKRRATGALIRTGVQTKSLRADLVVDARGRSSDIGKMLAAFNMSITVEKLPSSLSYATRIYQETPTAHGVRQRYVPIHRTLRDRGLVISPIEGGRVTVTLINNGHAPPTTEEAFATQAAPLLGGFVLGDAQSPVHVFRNFSGRRYVFHSASSWPDGFIALGDAACIVNPAYGQGMTIAAMQADLLRQSLSHGSFERRFQRAVDGTTAFAWLLATMESDVTTILPLNLRLFRRYLDRIFSVARFDRVVHQAFVRAMHFVDSPYALMRPNIAARLFRHAYAKSSTRAPDIALNRNL